MTLGIIAWRLVLNIWMDRLESILRNLTTPSMLHISSYTQYPTSSDPLPPHTLSLTHIAPLHPPLITSVNNSYGFASFASFSTA